MEKKKHAKSSSQQTENAKTMREKADLDRLRFKMNHAMQLLKDEQKQQEGK